MSAIASFTFVGTVIAVIAAVGVTVLFTYLIVLFTYLIDKDSREYFHSLLEEWRRKGGGR